MEHKAKYAECDECRVKPGSPTLCADCLERRSEHYRTGSCRPPRACSPQAQQAARALDLRMDGYGRSFTETEIARQLSLADIGLAPEENQFAAVTRILEEMRSSELIKSFDLTIAQNSSGVRTVKIGWSRMLDFPSQTMSMPAANLTRQNFEVLEVMSS